MDKNLSVRAMILDIHSQGSRIKEMNKELNEYRTLLNYLLKKDTKGYFYCSNQTIKEISKSINIPYDKVRKQIKEIYLCLIDANNIDKFPFKIKETEVSFYLKGFLKPSHTILVKGLKHIPRKGEIVNIPYFKAYVGNSYFHVSEIYNEFIDDRFEIFISLESGSYNSYWELRKDQAIETGEISFMDSLKEDYELKQIILKNSPKTW